MLRGPSEKEQRKLCPRASKLPPGALSLPDWFTPGGDRRSPQKKRRQSFTIMGLNARTTSYERSRHRRDKGPRFDYGGDREFKSIFGQR